jgi:hypothetical protein
VAYRADIEIGVRGADKLRELQERVVKLSRAVEDANVKTLIDRKAVQSVSEYTSVVAKAADTLRETAIQLNAAGKASGDYADAISQYVTAIGQANTVQQIHNNLIADEIELRRKQKLAQAGIRETTQYSGPIGPGPASSVLGGQSTPVEERIRRTLDARKDELELQRALLTLEEKSAQIANEKLQTQGQLAALTARSVNAAKFQAAQTPAQLALPAFTERGLQLLDDSVKANASSLRIERALNGERQRGVRFLEKQTEEERRQLELGILGARTNALPGTGRARGAVPAGGFPTAGPMVSPGFTGMQRNIGRFGENLALGAGFPLLFGGGAGSVIGSVLGSFVGTGFGGQILGGALGQALDQALIKIKDIGNAIKTLDFNALTESGIRLSTEIQGQLDLLSQVGDTLTAQKILSQEIARETGTLPGVTEDVANSVNILSDSWRKVVNAVSTTVGIIGAPFAVALAAVLEAVNAIFRVLNGVFSLLGKGIKTVGQFVVQLVAGQGALDAINNGLDRMNSGLAEANAQAAQFRSTLNESVVRTSIELSANQALTPGVTSEDKITNLKIEKQKQLDLLFQDEVDARIKIRSENAKATAETVEGLIKQNDVLFKNKKQLIETTAQRQVTAEIQREQARLDADAARAAEKAARELERQRKEMERMAKLRAQQFTDAQRGFVLAEAGLAVTTAGDGEDEKAKVQAEFDKQRAERMFKYTELLSKALSDEERLTLIATQEMEAEKALIEVTRDLFSIDLKRSELLNSPTALTGAQQELELLAAKIQGKEQEYELQQKINDLVSKEGVPLEDARGILLTIQDLEKQNKAIETQKQLWADIYTTVAGELQSALTGLIEGTAQWGDVLSSILGSLGNLFINAAFTGLGGALKLPGFAEGGFVTRPTTAVVGEGGESEYVIPQSKMSAAMSRYARGARGESVIPGSGTSAQGGGAAAASMEPIDVRYSVERINNVEYVTADQFRAGMAQAAQQGAIQGERRAMRTLTNSAAARGRLGI